MLMYGVCSSIELDLRNFICANSIVLDIPSNMVSKAKSRNKRGTIGENFKTNNLKLLEELDLGDLCEIVSNNHSSFKVNLEVKQKFDEIFEKIIPIRNRTMHSRPVEFADRSILEEVLENIDIMLPSIFWGELINIRTKILENPSQILLDVPKDKEDFDAGGIYHNLPLPEFDDTGFVGRKENLKELTELILNKKSQIITIVGNGGIGKTAIAIKCLYNIIDNPDTVNRFDAIIWSSLKTKSLTSGEFTNIKNSIKTAEGMFSSIYDSVVEETGDYKKDILTFMDNFKTLLVIDNLETLTTEDVIDFLKEIPDESKVLITSRNGLGELETRYKLSPLDMNDSLTYFRLLCQYYGLELYKRPQAELKKLLKEDLYSSPLSIKWFVTSISFGAQEESLINNKDKLIEFSMSNIVERLTNQQKAILHLFLVQGTPLGYGEIDFYLTSQRGDIASDINVLLATSMLELKSSKYQINRMAKEYLSLFDSPQNEFVNRINNKRNDLNRILQDIQLNKEATPFNPTTLFAYLEDNTKKIASYYLKKALEHSSNKEWDKANDLINRAQEIAPGYFEVYKIKAFIHGENKDLYEAISSYRIAIENAENNFQRATVYYSFSKFYKDKMNNAESAYEMIELANNNYPDNKDIQLEKVRILIYLVRYQEAEDTLLKISPTPDDTDKYNNIYASRFADLYIRKGQQFSKRDFQKQRENLEKAIEMIEELDQIDRGTATILAKALNDLAHLVFDPSAKLLFERKFVEHFSVIVDNTNRVIYKMKTNILSNSSMYDPEIINLAHRLNTDFKKEAKKIVDPSKGLIIKVKETFGFIYNAKGSVHFNMNEVKYDPVFVGDYVTFELNEYSKKPSAKNVEICIDNQK